MKRHAIATALLLIASPAMFAQPRPFTVDDAMKLRSIVDVKIAPDGERVAYVVSAPNLAKNEHEGALYLVAASGGASRPFGEAVRIFNTPRPAPQLRWSFDGTLLGVIGFSGDKPQVFAVPLAGGDPRALTDSSEGVTAFEWSPDGKSLAYLTRDPMPAEEERQRKDKSYVIHVDAPERPTRLVVKAIDGGAPRTLTPPSQYVDSFSWSPDSSALAYSAASRSGFTAQYLTRIYAVPAGGGEPRPLVDRAGMNTRPQ